MTSESDTGSFVHLTLVSSTAEITMEGELTELRNRWPVLTLRERERLGQLEEELKRIEEEEAELARLARKLKRKGMLSSKDRDRYEELQANSNRRAEEKVQEAAEPEPEPELEPQPNEAAPGEPDELPAPEVPEVSEEELKRIKEEEAELATLSAKRWLVCSDRQRRDELQARHDEREANKAAREAEEAAKAAEEERLRLEEEERQREEEERLKGKADPEPDVKLNEEKGEEEEAKFARPSKRLKEKGRLNSNEEDTAAVPPQSFALPSLQPSEQQAMITVISALTSQIQAFTTRNESLAADLANAKNTITKLETYHDALVFHAKEEAKRKAIRQAQHDALAKKTTEHERAIKEMQASNETLKAELQTEQERREETIAQGICDGLRALIIADLEDSEAVEEKPTSLPKGAVSKTFKELLSELAAANERVEKLEEVVGAMEIEASKGKDRIRELEEQLGRAY